MIMLTGCGNQQPNEENLPALSGHIVQDTSRVTGMILGYDRFAKEIISQGTIEPSAKADIIFPFEATITQINVKSGQRVSQGYVIAKLDISSFKHELAIVDAEIEQIQLQIKTKLISLGYDGKDTSSIDADLWKNLVLEAGIPMLKLKRTDVKRKINEAVIKAPFTGVIADLQAHVGNPTVNYDKICTLIAQNNLRVKFPVLEAELKVIRKGMPIKISPIYDPSLKINGKIKAINPQVDDSGLIWIYGSVASTQRNLLDGMRVNVSLQEILKNELVVPKEAVVDRQDRYVSFVYKDGQAHWVYVQLVEENASHYAIDESGLQAGDTVIVINNFDLAHLEPVILDSIIH